VHQNIGVEHENLCIGAWVGKYYGWHITNSRVTINGNPIDSIMHSIFSAVWRRHARWAIESRGQLFDMGGFADAREVLAQIAAFLSQAKIAAVWRNR